MIADLARTIEAHRGLAFDTPRLPAARVGQPYRASLTAQGGRPPYTWEVEEGSLPPGLRLAPDGSISGVPSRAEQRPFLLRVTDRSASPRDGRPQSFRRSVHIAFEPAVPPR